MKPELSKLEKAKLIGANIKRLRHARGWTQSDLAYRMGSNFTKSSICQYEAGTRVPAFSTLLPMVNAFGCLFSDIVPMPPPVKISA